MSPLATKASARPKSHSVVMQALHSIPIPKLLHTVVPMLFSPLGEGDASPERTGSHAYKIPRTFP